MVSCVTMSIRLPRDNAYADVLRITDIDAMYYVLGWHVSGWLSVVFDDAMHHGYIVRRLVGG